MFQLLALWAVRGLLVVAAICAIVLAFWLAELIANFVVHVFDCIAQEYVNKAWRDLE
jgi:hypothetical protein